MLYDLNFSFVPTARIGNKYYLDKGLFAEHGLFPWPVEEF